MTIYAVDYYLHYIPSFTNSPSVSMNTLKLCFSLVESHYMVTSMREQAGQAVSHP